MSEFCAVRYKCECMAAEATVEVAFRAPGQDIADWVERTLREAIGKDHAARSPLCARTKTEYVKIPLPENAPSVGGRPKLDS